MQYLKLVILSVTFGAALLSPQASLAAPEDLRVLLRELLIQVPAREVSAPDLSLPDSSGATVRLADYQGRAVMIYFWTTY